MARVQLGIDAVFMARDVRRVSRDKTKGVVRELTILERQKLKLETELRHGSEHATADKMREDAIKEELATVKEVLTAIRLEGANLGVGT